MVLGHKHHQKECHLFKDLLKLSLKAELPHNGNIYPSIPIAYLVHIKKTLFRRKLNISNLSGTWNFKVVTLFMGIQLWYTKYFCFLYNRDSCVRPSCYQVKS